MNKIIMTESTPASFEENKPAAPEANWMDKYGEAAAAAISGILLIAGWIAGHLSVLSADLIYTFSFIIGGYASAKDGILTLVQDHDLDVNLLMIFAAVGAASIGYWAEGAALIFIFSLSGALETYTNHKSSSEISALMSLTPETAMLYQEGRETEVTIDQLHIGSKVLIKPGERIPADSIITQGTSSIDQASITGESIPVDKGEGDDIFAGTLNGQGTLIAEVVKSNESSLFAKIIQLVQEAQSEKPASQLFIEGFERIYAWVVIAVTLLLILLPHYLMHTDWQVSWYKAMVFMVVASPCAVVASIMPAVLSAISNGARQGLLFKGGAHLENIAQANIIAFDKTGTLTYGKPQVTDIIPFSGYSDIELMRCAASIERYSEHPIAAAIVREAEERSIAIENPDSMESVTGSGVRAKLLGQRWKVGKPGFIDASLRSDAYLNEMERLESEGKTLVAVQNETELVGLIALRDEIRGHTKHTIRELHKLGVKVAMLTGDHRITAEAIADEAGIDLVFSELLPQDKVDTVNKLRQDYGKVVMVGDGVNDAPALASASVGIAMGGTGSDVALETADLVLMNDDIDRIGTAIALGKRLKRIVRQNLVFALTVIVCLITTNFIIGLKLPLGVVGHEGSTILVILNGLRLLR